MSRVAQDRRIDSGGETVYSNEDVIQYVVDYYTAVEVVVFFFYLVLSVGSPSSVPSVQHAEQDTQSGFCSSGCPSGSSSGPVHGI